MRASQVVRVPESRLEGLGFKSWCQQVLGSVSVPNQQLAGHVETWAILFTLCRLPLPTHTGQHGMVGQQHQHFKALQSLGPQSPRGCERVYYQGSGSGQLELCAGGARNFWVKKGHCKRVSRLKIASELY